MDSILQMLKRRYGGNDAWNPSAGQNTMSFEEWLDRHPALANVNGNVQRSRYSDATSAEGGRAFQAATPNWQSMSPTVRADMMHGAAPTPNPVVMSADLGAPDAPPGGPVKPATPPGGGTYKDYLQAHWADGKSTKKRGQAYQRAAKRNANKQSAH